MLCTITRRLCSDGLCFRFRIDNTDHIIDVVYQALPQQYEQINIICPHYSRQVQVGR